MLPTRLLLLGMILGGAAGVAMRPPALQPRSVRRLPPPLLSAESSFESKLRQFAPTSDLPSVRGELVRLQNQLSVAIEEQDFTAAAMVRDDIAELRSKDPAIMSATLREQLEQSVAEEDYGRAASSRDQLRVLRRFLPQYQLAGLWKGNYPNHGDELVRVHYEGDVLYATKVTGDVHVPAGEITFKPT